ncbi:heparinase II/III-family protein, partial [bacterium AH-315-F03]|nr:heparinase II/III-family protein [bacterium AH-315-F03]
FGFKEATKAKTLAHPKSQPQRSKFYRTMGLAIMRHDDLALSVNVANIGVNGIGGHKHNDQLALTLCWDDDEVIIDPGMYCYTSDISERNRLRSVNSHSTISLNSEETDRFLQGFPFALRRDGVVATDTWLSTVELDLLKASHSCYSRLTGAPEISRTIYFDKLTRFYLIRDELLPRKIAFTTDAHQLETALIVAGMTKFEDNATAKISLTGSAQKNVTIRCYTPGVEMSVEPFVYSPAYGVKKTGSRIAVLARTGVTEIIWGMFLNYEDECKQDSEMLIFEKMRLLHWPTAELRRWAVDTAVTHKHIETVI